MVVGTTADNTKAFVNKILCKNSCVGLYLLCIFFPAWFEVLAEGYCFSCNNMLKRTALVAWEYCRVEEHTHWLYFALLCGKAPRICKVFAQKYNTTTWSTECFVSCGCYDMSIFEWVL